MKNEKILGIDSDYLCLFAGILIAVLYKFWKMMCLKLTGGYYTGQMLFSIYRAISSMVGLYILAKSDEKFVDRLRLTENKVSLSIIFAFFFIDFGFKYIYLNGYTYNSGHFIFETVINSFVGIFEELIFRGLIFLSIKRILDSRSAIIISSLLFSIWHYDVVAINTSYFSIFTFGVLAAFLVENEFSFTYVIVLHALADIIHFGFEWNDKKSLTVIESVSAATYLSIIFLFLLVSKKKNVNYKIQ